jgi:hypothetical protein
MSSDDTAARAEFEAWWQTAFGVSESRGVCLLAWLACWNSSRSIPAAAALLREAGWRVEEPDSEDKPCYVCGNEERGQGGYLTVDCPGDGYNGTGAREVRT